MLIVAAFHKHTRYRERYRSSHNRSKRLHIIPKHSKTQKRFLLADERECFNKYGCCKKLIRRYSGNGLVAKRNSQNFIQVNEHVAATSVLLCNEQNFFGRFVRNGFKNFGH